MLSTLWWYLAVMTKHEPALRKISQGGRYSFVVVYLDERSLAIALTELAMDVTQSIHNNTVEVSLLTNFIVGLYSSNIIKTMNMTENIMGT